MTTASRLVLALAWICACAPSTETGSDDSGASSADAGPTHAEKGKRYSLTPEGSKLYVVTRNDGRSLLSKLGHDHTVVASDWTGTVTWSEKDVTGCRVHIEVPVTKLLVDPKGYRDLAGLDGDTSESDREKIYENVVGDRVLDLAKGQSVVFDAKRCEPAEDGKVKVTGSLSMHGQTHEIVAPMKVTVDSGRFHAVGTVAFDGSDWEMKPFTAVVGGIRHKDRIELHIDVRGR